MTSQSKTSTIKIDNKFLVKFQLGNEFGNELYVNRLNGCSTVGKEIVVSFAALRYTVLDIFHMDGMEHLVVCMSSWS